MAIYTTYSRALSKSNVLSHTEQQILFTIMNDRKKSVAVRNNARTRLYESNMKFVVSVANSNLYKSCPVALDDRIAAGMIGLGKAIDTFDVSTGNKFITHAMWWIRGYITKALNDSTLIRLPANKRNDIMHAVKKSKNGEVDSDIAALMNINNTASFDAPVGGDSSADSNRTLAEILTANTESCEGEVDRAALKQMANDFLKMLPEKEATAMECMAGIGHDKPLSLRETGVYMGYSHNRVRQLAGQALRRIRKYNSEDHMKEMQEAFHDAVSE